MIVLQDDGKGMDPVKLRKKAAEKGLIAERQA
jgi:two-component system chemotaxis sensor kinase CheA